MRFNNMMNKCDYFSLNLRVSEVDTPANSADTTITITVVDRSDNAPVCTTRVFRCIFK